MEFHLICSTFIFVTPLLHMASFSFSFKCIILRGTSSHYFAKNKTSKGSLCEILHFLWNMDCLSIQISSFVFQLTWMLIRGTWKVNQKSQELLHVLFVFLYYNSLYGVDFMAFEQKGRQENDFRVVGVWFTWSVLGNRGTIFVKWRSFIVLRMIFIDNMI